MSWASGAWADNTWAGTAWAGQETIGALANYTVRRRKTRKPDDTQEQIDAKRAEIELAQQQIEASRLRQEQLEAENSILLAEAQALATLRSEIASDMQAIEVMRILLADLHAQRHAELMEQAQIALEQQKIEDYQMRVYLITKAMDEEA